MLPSDRRVARDVVRARISADEHWLHVEPGLAHVLALLHKPRGRARALLPAFAPGRRRVDEHLVHAARLLDVDHVVARVRAVGRVHGIDAAAMLLDARVVPHRQVKPAARRRVELPGLVVDRLFRAADDAEPRHVDDVLAVVRQPGARVLGDGGALLEEEPPRRVADRARIDPAKVGVGDRPAQGFVHELREFQVEPLQANEPRDDRAVRLRTVLGLLARDVVGRLPLRLQEPRKDRLERVGRGSHVAYGPVHARCGAGPSVAVLLGHAGRILPLVVADGRVRPGFGPRQRRAPDPLVVRIVRASPQRVQLILQGVYRLPVHLDLAAQRVRLPDAADARGGDERIPVRRRRIEPGHVF